jgi:hypothetical protein
MDAMTHLKALLLRWIIVFAVLLLCDALWYVIVFANWGAPAMHVGWLALASVLLALIIYGIHLLAASHPETVWVARLHVPRWTALEPFFAGSRMALTLVVLSYVLFYVTQGLDKHSAWAVWVNNNVLNFFLFCHHFTAVEVIRIEIAGYALYLALYLIYNRYCPQILAHSIRKEGALTREDAALVFVRTVERHGRAIPGRDLGRSIAAFGEERRGLFEEDTKELLDKRAGRLKTLADSDRPPVEATVAAAAAMARLFPARLALETYHLGVSLFDIIYTSIRGFICVGLAVAILATSLPIAAKLLWVVFPRLGAPCMTTTLVVPPDFRDSEWVEFKGKVESSSGADFILIPESDANERWTLANSDVAVFPTDGSNRIFLRIHGTVQERKKIGLPSISQPQTGLRSRMNVQCGAAGSQCANHIEICCGSNQVKGHCYGDWSCPDP